MPSEPRIRLHPRFTHLIRAAGVVVLVGEEEVHALDDPMAKALLPELDGRSTAVEIVERLAPHHSATNLHYLILVLQDQGLVVPVPDGASEVGGGPLVEAWERARAEGGHLLAPGVPGGSPDGWILLCVDYLDPRLDGLVDRSPAGAPVVLARAGARSGWVGPGLGDDGACLTCLQDRLRLNLTARGLVHHQLREADLEVVTLPPGPPPPTLRLLAAYLSSADPPGAELFVIGSGAPDPPVRHPVHRLPQCPRCGNPERTIPGADLRLRPQPASALAGGSRIRSPEETLQVFGDLLSPITGVVRHVERVAVPGAPEVHVFTAGHANHHGAGDLGAIRDDRRDHSGGKGRTEMDARVSAFCEALERFSAIHRGNEPVTIARASELRGTVLGPSEILGFSNRQYEEREHWNACLRGPFQYVPEPYADQPIGWAPVREAFSSDRAWAPAAALYLGATDPGSPFIDADSNGLAGGNCLEEAALQGLLELIERDAVAVWWYNRLLRPGVDLDAILDPWIQDMRRLHRDLGRSLYALDLTHDLGVPVVAAVSTALGDEPDEIVFGFGAHLDPAIALSRAVTEVNQMLPTVLQDRAVRRRRLMPDFADALAWWDEETLDRQPHLVAHPGAPRGRARLARSIGPSTRTSKVEEQHDLRDLLEVLVTSLHDAGLRVWLHDLTRPDVSFPTVRVLVPGLRHFWKRLGPGRLYDVPVALGWLDRVRSEAEMNPLPIFV